MYLSIIEVKPIKNYQLQIKFENNEWRIFDMNPYLNTGLFQQLKDERKFNNVHVSLDSIAWADDIDLDPEVLYMESIPLT